MTIALILIALVVLAATVHLVALVASDGLGHRPASDLPRSHYRDQLERPVC